MSNTLTTADTIRPSLGHLAREGRCERCSKPSGTLDNEGYCPDCEYLQLEGDEAANEAVLNVLESALDKALNHIHPDDLAEMLARTVRAREKEGLRPAANKEKAQRLMELQHARVQARRSPKTVTVTPDQGEQVHRVIGRYLFDLGFCDDMTRELGAELDGPGPRDPRQRKYIGWLGKRLTISASILEDVERGELSATPDVIGTFADCQLMAERTLDADRGLNVGDREDPEAVRLAASHLMDTCAVRVLIGGDPEAVAA